MTLRKATDVLGRLREQETGCTLGFCLAARPMLVRSEARPWQRKWLEAKTVWVFFLFPFLCWLYSKRYVPLTGDLLTRQEMIYQVCKHASLYYADAILPHARHVLGGGQNTLTAGAKALRCRVLSLHPQDSQPKGETGWRSVLNKGLRPPHQC